MTAATERHQSIAQQQRRLRPKWTWFYAVLIIIGAAILAFNIFRPITVLPRITLAPGFALKDQTATTLTSEDQRGRLTLYSFSYGACDDECTQTPAQIASVRAGIAQRFPDDIGLDIVTISLDPVRDTPHALAEVAAVYEGDSAETINWHWLTDDPARVRHVVGGGFALYYDQRDTETGEYAIEFQPRYVLVDRLGIIRAEYFTSTPETDLLERDINFLLSEERNSTGVAKIGYEAAHLFLCYPR